VAARGRQPRRGAHLRRTAGELRAAPAVFVNGVAVLTDDALANKVLELGIARVTL
jgi:hypothetical protein